MVTFSCDSCAEIVKKSKASQHIFSCPNATMTCIDCSTTFRGGSYTSHTSCVSEAEKYQKSLYKGNKKNKQDRTQQKFDTPNNNNNEQLSENKTPSNNESNLKKKRKNKDKKDQQQDTQPNGNKLENRSEKDIANAAIKQENKKKRKKNKKSVNDINGNDDIKIGESKKDNSDDVNLNESQTDETPKKENNNIENTENLNNSSSKKKKKQKNGSVNNNKNDLDLNVINGIDHKQKDETTQLPVEILKKGEEFSDKKNKKRKSVEFMLFESPKNNEKQKTREENGRYAKKLKFSHKNGVTHNLSIPAVVKKIFESNNHEELNLKCLEEMVIRELIPDSNLSVIQLKEKFLDDIVLTMNDGKIILKQNDI